MWRRLWADESGQAMIEYALIAASLAVGLMVSIKLLGWAFGGQFENQARGLERAR